ncbi:glutathione-dependent formaldehyde-activating enzyme protein [Rutstroemia sp. NJR-2017a WRK4]|nr:glutathione-dependent formaldehyde-activating enzyme protein [Rutstroemia sp. NJR-2017a WRK4]
MAAKTVTTTYQPLDVKILLYVEETSPEERTTHEASCHCGAVTFSVTLKFPFPKYPVNSCSCSICSRNGYLLVYPMRSDIKFSPDSASNLSSYRFGSKAHAHKFCKNCGSSMMIDLRTEHKEPDPRKDIVAVNIRHFKDIDLDAMTYTFFDGKNLI